MQKGKQEVRKVVSLAKIAEPLLRASSPLSKLKNTNVYRQVKSLLKIGVNYHKISQRVMSE